MIFSDTVCYCGWRHESFEHDARCYPDAHISASLCHNADQSQACVRTRDARSCHTAFDSIRCQELRWTDNNRMWLMDIRALKQCSRWIASQRGVDGRTCTSQNIGNKATCEATAPPASPGPLTLSLTRRSTAATGRHTTSAETRTNPNKSHRPTKKLKEPTELSPNQAPGRQQQQSSMARSILAWAQPQSQETDDQHNISATVTPPTVSTPRSGLDGGVPARELSPPEAVAAGVDEQEAGERVENEEVQPTWLPDSLRANASRDFLYQV